MTTRLARPRTAPRRIPWQLPGTYAALVLAVLATLTPFLIMVLLSLKPRMVMTLPALLSLNNLSTESYRKIFETANVLGWTVNSLIYSVVSVILVILTASMAGYAFAKKRFPGKEPLFWTFLAMLMVPGQVTLIPLFIIISKFGWIDTYWGLIIPTVANVQAVFMMRQFITSIPDELLEAARIDGASEWRIYWQIILPQTGPILATLGTFVFLWHWNDFLWPLLAAQSDGMRTLTVGLASLHAQNVDPSEIMAGTVISFIPTFIIFLALQRYFVQSIITSGLK